MAKLDWVRDLVRAEQQLEASDMIDFSVGFNGEKVLEDETAQFLVGLKESFVDYCTTFNQMKGASIGNIKIYGIANTVADFMLFRNGLKLIFSMKKPGIVGIRVSQSGGYFPPGTTASTEVAAVNGDEDYIEAIWGAFNELSWTHRGLTINDNENVVRFYLGKFIRDSAR